MRNLLLFCLLTSLSTLMACSTKPVTVIAPTQFKHMGNHMGKELIARNMLDSNMKYTVGHVTQSTKEYGKLLYAQLSPHFLFDDVAKDGAPTFAASLKKGEKVHIHSTGFTMSSAPIQSKRKVTYAGGGRSIDVSMVAISDWDGDGVQDWLVSCQYIAKLGTLPRVFYLAIPENTVKAGQPLQAKVISVYEDLGVVGRLYLRESHAQKEAKEEKAPQKTYEAQQGEAHHVVPGLKNITAPPKTGAATAKPKTGVQAKNL